MSNSVFVVCSKKDSEYIQSVKACAKRENLDLDFCIESADDFEMLERRIEDCEAVLLLTTDAFREDSLVKQMVKYAHDLNKTLIAMGFHSGGLFNKQSWLKSEMNVNTTVYGYKDDEQLGEVLAQLRSVLGVAVAMGERIGGLVTFNLDSPCCVCVNEKQLFQANTPGTYQYRLKAGDYTFCFNSVKISGAKVFEKFLRVVTNAHSSVNESIRDNEIKYLNNAVASLTKNIEIYTRNLENRNAALVESNRILNTIEQRLNEPEPTLKKVEASFGIKVFYALLLGGIGLFFFGFGAIIGLFLGPYFAQSSADSDAKKQWEREMVAYRKRMDQLKIAKSDELSKVRQNEQQKRDLVTRLENQNQQLNRANELLASY